MVEACVERGAVTAMAADDECQGREATVRVGNRLSDDHVGWPCLRSPACPSHGQPRLMHDGACALGARSAVVFRTVLVAWSGSRTRDGRLRRSLLYPTELSSGDHPGIEPGTLRCDPSMARISTGSGDAAWAASTGLRPNAAHRRGSRTQGPVSVRLSRQMRGRLGFVSSGAIPSAGARPAIRARRRGCAGLRAESPRNGSARTAGTAAACLLPPVCGRPCGHCMHHRP